MMLDLKLGEQIDRDMYRRNSSQFVPHFEMLLADQSAC